ncbi:MAG: helix-turn-helix domain-containing protein [Pseudonocardia sp.]
MTLGDDRYPERPCGERLREWREKTKRWTRLELAEQVEALSYRLKEARGNRIDTRLISRWEKGEIRRPQSVYMRILAHLRAPTHPDAVHDGSAASLERVDDDEMKRRLFLRSAGAAVAAAVVLPGESYGGRAVPAKVDAGTIRAIRAPVDDLYIRDQAVGGAVLARHALAQYYDARHMLDESDYSEKIGRDLMSVAGELAVCVGWLSYDAGNQNDARRLYNEAFVLADQAGDGLLAIQAIEKMAQQATFIAGHGRHKGAAREALRLGARLTDLARTESSSRLHALAAARQAIAFAASGSEAYSEHPSRSSEVDL